MKTYTLTQVIDAMQLGEMAIKVESNCGGMEVGTAMYFDESDGNILKYKHSGNDVLIAKATEGEENKYIIVKRNF